MNTKLRHLTSLYFLLAAASHAADWPQYRGPQRNDISAETGLLKNWPDGGPRLLWTFKNAGIGNSGPAIVGDRLYTIGAQADTESLIALDLRTVRNGTVVEAWRAAIGPTFDFTGNKWSAGPSATPTVDGSLIYALGGRGDLVCVDARTGRQVWRRDIPGTRSARIRPRLAAVVAKTLISVLLKNSVMSVMGRSKRRSGLSLPYFSMASE